jgi:hypothetical protein
LHWEYHELLQEREERYSQVVTVDCKTMSKELYGRKGYGSCTGNNINHPNDAIHELYARSLLKAFQIEGEK